VEFTPTTELEAVNRLLGYLGEAPVNSLNSGVSEADQARKALYSASRELQMGGLHCNRENGYKLLPDDSGIFNLPVNVLQVKIADTEQVSATVRGSRLYNLDDHCYTFAGHSSLLAEIIFFLPFEELPEPVRNYVTVTAARRFLVATLGTEELTQVTAADEMRARNGLMAYEYSQNEYNYLTPYEQSMAARLSAPGGAAWV